MIIKVPLYLEVEGKFKPDRSRQIVQDVRTAVNAYFSKANGGILRVNGYEGIQSMKILSEAEVRTRLLKDVQIVEES